MEKRLRTANYTTSEKEVLLNIVAKYRDSVENKKTNAVSVSDKKEAWFKITQEFNAVSPNMTFRPTDSLKKYYENQRLDLKKRAAEEKKSLYVTGGGPPVTVIGRDPTDDIFLDIVNNKTIFVLTSPYGGDRIPDTDRSVSAELELTDERTQNIETEKYCFENEIEIEYQNEGDNQDAAVKDQDNYGTKNWSNIVRNNSKTLKRNIDKVFSPRTSTTNTFKSSRRRPVVNTLTSSKLGEKYEELIRQKSELVEFKKQGHILKIQALQLDIELKKQQLQALKQKEL